MNLFGIATDNNLDLFQKRYLIIDSRNINIDTNSNDNTYYSFNYPLSSYINVQKYMRQVNANIPNSIYTITEGNNSFIQKDQYFNSLANEKTYYQEPGFYDATSLASSQQTILRTINGGAFCTFTNSTGKMLISQGNGFQTNNYERYIIFSEGLQEIFGLSELTKKITFT